MPTFRPFAGLRYSPEAGPISSLVSPPYDVFGLEERRSLADGHPRNIVHVDYPVESDGPERYAVAARTIAEWRSEGTLREDDRPSFYLYRMEFVDALGRSRRTVGIVGGLGLRDEDVLPHEETTPKAKSDRLDLMSATRLNLSPIWGLSLARGLTAALEAPGRLVAEVRVAGVVHSLEQVDDMTRTEDLAALVGSAPVLIADGHHRLAVSRTFMEGDGSGLPGASLAMAYVAELTESQLTIEAIHRMISGVDADELEAVLYRDYDDVGEISVSSEELDRGGVLQRMQADGAICLLRPDGRGTLLRPRSGSFPGVRPIDSARLAAALEGSGAVLEYQHDVSTVLERLGERVHSAAVLINPVSIGEIRDVAESGRLMPPKSTFFTPKLLTGLVIRDLVDGG